MQKFAFAGKWIIKNHPSYWRPMVGRNWLKVRYHVKRTLFLMKLIFKFSNYSLRKNILMHANVSNSVLLIIHSYTIWMGAINIHKYLCRPLRILAFYTFTGRTLFGSSFEFSADNIILFDKHYLILWCAVKVFQKAFSKVNCFFSE